jgi:hypothetical protein
LLHPQNKIEITSKEIILLNNHDLDLNIKKGRQIISAFQTCINLLVVEVAVVSVVWAEDYRFHHLCHRLMSRTKYVPGCSCHDFLAYDWGLDIRISKT